MLLSYQVILTCTYLEYSVLCWVGVVELMLCCCVLYDDFVKLNLYRRGQRSIQAPSLLYPKNSGSVRNRTV